MLLKITIKTDSTVHVPIDQSAQVSSTSRLATVFSLTYALRYIFNVKYH